MDSARIETLVAMIRLLNGSETWNLHEIWCYLVEKGLSCEKPALYKQLKFLSNLGLMVEHEDGSWQVKRKINLNQEVSLTSAEAIQVFVTLSESFSLEEIKSMPIMNRLAGFLSLDIDLPGMTQIKPDWRHV